MSHFLLTDRLWNDSSDWPLNKEFLLWQKITRLRTRVKHVVFSKRSSAVTKRDTATKIVDRLEETAVRLMQLPRFGRLAIIVCSPASSGYSWSLCRTTLWKDNICFRFLRSLVIFSSSKSTCWILFIIPCINSLISVHVINI